MVNKLSILCENVIGNEFDRIFSTQSSRIHGLSVNLKARLFSLLSHRALLTDENLPYLLNCRTRTFDFRDCSKITDQSLILLAQCSLTAQIERQRLQPNESTITTSVLNPSIIYLRGLTITDDGLSKFVQQYPSLRKIRLQHCLELTDESLSVIARSCLRLIEFDFSGCLQITDQGVHYLRSLMHLRSLALAQTSITDQSLITIGQSSFRHTLNEINLRMCTEITDEGFLFLIKNCTHLKMIGFVQCPKISERAKANFNAHTHSISHHIRTIPV